MGQPPVSEFEGVHGLDNLKQNNKVKKLILIISGLIVAVLLVVVITKLFSINNPENSSVLVYGKANSVTVKIKDLSVEITDSTASDFYCDKENKRVFFTVASASEDNLFDLCCVQVDRSEISTVMIDYAVKSDYRVSGGNVYYLKYNEKYSAFEGYVCDPEDKVRRAFDTNVDGVFPLGGDDFYYSKLHGDSLAFYKYENSGSVKTKLLTDVININYYPDAQKPHLFVESLNGESKNKELRYCTGEGISLVCENLAQASYDDYSAGGNLYFYTSSDNAVSWSHVISDEFVEEDKDITKPSRDDYESENGISTAYNEAFLKYQDKLIRDEIRESLNEMVEKYGFNAPVYTAYSVCDGKVMKVAEEIDPSRVYAVSDFGTPKMVYESVELDTTSVDMATLVAIYPRNSFDDVINYAWSVVDGSVISDGICFAAHSDGGELRYSLDFYDKKSTLFAFSSDGSSLFAFIKDGSNASARTVYCNSFGDDLMPLKEMTVSAGVTDYKVTENGLLYLKEDDGKTSGDVFQFVGGKTEKISNAASAFIFNGEDCVVSIKYNDSDSDILTADYYLCRNGKEELICENALPSAFRFILPEKAAYVAGGALCVYNGGKTAQVDTDVKEIILFV